MQAIQANAIQANNLQQLILSFNNETNYLSNMLLIKHTTLLKRDIVIMLLHTPW